MMRLGKGSMKVGRAGMRLLSEEDVQRIYFEGKGMSNNTVK